jgi:hypothetical protein
MGFYQTDEIKFELRNFVSKQEIRETHTVAIFPAAEKRGREIGNISISSADKRNASGKQDIS